MPTFPSSTPAPTPHDFPTPSWPLPEIPPEIAGKEGKHLWVVALFHQLTDKEAKKLALRKRNIRVGKTNLFSASSVGCARCARSWEVAHGTPCIETNTDAFIADDTTA